MKIKPQCTCKLSVAKLTTKKKSLMKDPDIVRWLKEVSKLLSEEFNKKYCPKHGTLKTVGIDVSEWEK